VTGACATSRLCGFRSKARRIRKAGFAESKTLEGFDWNFNPKNFDRVQMEELATGDFIRRRTSAQLLADLTASLADKTLSVRLRRYSKPDFLIIDEFGFDKIERVECPEAAHLLYKIIAARNQKRSTALVTNVDFDKWGDYLSDGPLAMAFLDRMVEGAIILKVKGK
jgi:DNA replication protein DnaC